MLCANPFRAQEIVWFVEPPMCPAIVSYDSRNQIVTGTIGAQSCLSEDGAYLKSKDAGQPTALAFGPRQWGLE